MKQVNCIILMIQREDLMVLLVNNEAFDILIQSALEQPKVSTLLSYSLNPKKSILRFKTVNNKPKGSKVKTSK